MAPGGQRGVGDAVQPAGDVGAQLTVDAVEDLLTGLAVVRLRGPGGEGGLPREPVPLEVVRGVPEPALEALTAMLP